MNRVTSGMSAGDAVSMGSRLADTRNLVAQEIYNRPTITADDIAKFSRELRELPAATTPGSRSPIST